jgi:hypothetical protein
MRTTYVVWDTCKGWCRQTMKLYLTFPLCFNLKKFCFYIYMVKYNFCSDCCLLGCDTVLWSLGYQRFGGTLVRLYQLAACGPHPARDQPGPRNYLLICFQLLQAHLFSLLRRIWKKSWFLSRLLLYVQVTSEPYRKMYVFRVKYSVRYKLLHE